MKQRGYSVQGIKYFVTILFVAVLCGLISIPAFAVSEITYLDLAQGSITVSESDGITTYLQNGVSTVCTGACVIRQTDCDTTATANTITVTGGKVAFSISGLNVSANSAPIAVEAGQLTLTLLSENTLAIGATSGSYPGIYVPSPGELVIKGCGVLYATGRWAPGIGTGVEKTTGKIVINGGTIYAYGDYYAAAIGGGEDSTSGNIIINGGTVNAISSGSNCAAGIGYGVGGKSTVGSVTINGGIVTASSVNASGIAAAKVLITGGEVKAAGYNGIYSPSITIDGGTINATGSNAGIGSFKPVVVINDGSVTAKGSGGAGIGGTEDYNGCNITINGGTVTASSYDGAGIGGGSWDIYQRDLIITITGGTVEASSYRGAGIGNGFESSKGHPVVTISDATVKATSTSASGIGGTDTHNQRINTGGSVRISNSTVTAAGEYFAIGGCLTGYGTNIHGCSSIQITNCITDFSNAAGTSVVLQEQIYDLSLISAAALDDEASPGARFETKPTSFSGEIVSYQWQTCQYGYGTFTDIEGATDSVAYIPITSENNGYYFRCAVTNVYGNVAYTDAAQGFVLDFAKHPADMSVSSGDMVSMLAEVTGGTVSYQWQRSLDNGATWFDLPDQNFTTLAILGTEDLDGAWFRCVATAGNGDQLCSNTVKLTVTGEPAVTYTVQYYQQTADGNGYVLCEKKVVKADAGTSVTAETVEYEHFTENDKLGVHSGTVAEDGSLVLSRYYDRNTYAITFDMQGGSALPDVQAVWGASVTRPADPSRYGYTFGGWYADSACTQEYAFTTMPQGGTTVYAKWISGDEGRSGVEYTINGILLRDGSTYEPVSGIPTGNLLAEISVTNLCSTHVDTVMLVTYDTDGRMLEIGYLYASVPVGGTFTFGMDVDNTDGNVGSVKAFVLSALNSILPLAEAKSYSET